MRLAERTRAHAAVPTQRSCAVRASCVHPVCSPTRVSMTTGKNPARTHVDDWVGHGYTNNKDLRSPKWAATGLPPGGPHAALPQILADHGYRTLHVGKAHFGGK